MFEQYDHLYDGLITAKVIADSTNFTGNRLTTVLVRIPKFINAEMNTHRVFSRNVGSCLGADAKLDGKVVGEKIDNTYRVPISRVDKLFNKTRKSAKRDKFTAMGFFYWDELYNVIRDAPMKSIWESGVKGVYNLHISKYMNTLITGDHKIMTPNGWKTLEDYDIYDIKEVMGWPAKSLRIQPYKVDSVEYIGELPVYDFEMDNDYGTAFSSGILIHNSRAKPFSITKSDVVNNGFTPQLWVKKHKGMQGNSIIEDEGIISQCDYLWNAAKRQVTHYADALNRVGVSKQYVNRLIEPFMYIDYLVSSTEWENFITLRDDSSAQFEIQVAARTIQKELENSIPTYLEPGQWHLPFLDDDDIMSLTPLERAKVSSSRCARTSYKKPSTNQKPVLEDDLGLFHTLAVSKPIHASPLEHIAIVPNGKLNPHSANFVGWRQFRKVFEGSGGNQENLEYCINLYSLPAIT